MRIGFGVDLGAFGRRRGTAIVAARRIKDRLDFSILKGTAFDRVFAGREQISIQLTAERDFLISLLKLGVVAVDVPIFLQGLPHKKAVRYAWELTSRPVDKAFGALPPLSSYLGFCVARFLPHADLSSTEKYRLVETYPAASLDLCQKTKGALHGVIKTKIPQVTADECDAVICAMAAIADAEDLLCGRELDVLLQEKLRSYPSNSKYAAPDGYRLLKNIPSDFCMKVLPYETWSSELDCN